MNDLKELFGNVCTNSEEITNKFICLLMFFELVDINDNNTSNVDISKFIYACSLYETTLNDIITPISRIHNIAMAIRIAFFLSFYSSVIFLLNISIN